jgi:predicted CXXCH cytochrome family protein
MISRMVRTTLVLAAACWPLFASADVGFAGTQVCAECHAAQHAAWQGSHHDLAMQEATDATVLGDFNDAEITAQGVTSRFFRRDGQFVVRTDGADGKPADFVIHYTFGIEPLQQYLVEFPDGRLQALGLAWDARGQEQGGQRWFHLYPDQAVDHAHPLHWTGPEQNANYQCIDCHVTGYQKNYDPAADRFASSWAEIDVACEACHGPGARHVAWAKGTETLAEGDLSFGLAVLLHDRKGVSWQMDPATGIARRSKPPAASTELEVCAGCHARRGALRDGKAGQARFLDYHLPAFLTEPLYYPDGQIREEVYVWGSFLQSRMHAAGVSCSDCHDPHSNRLRAPGSQVCATCHAPAKFAVTAHHGHPADSAGADSGLR